MKIAVDIDKTLFDCSSTIYQLFNFFALYKKKSKKLKYDVLDVSKVTKTGFAIPFGKMSNYREYREILNACMVLNNWHKNNHTVILLSSRPNFKAFQRVIVDLINKFNIDVDFIVVACNNKAEFCKKYGIDVLVDDSRENCYNCEQKGVRSILFKDAINGEKRERLENQGFRVASNWIEVNLLVNFIRNVRRNYFLPEKIIYDEEYLQPIFQG